MFGDEVVARAQILHLAAQRPEGGLDLGALGPRALPRGCRAGGRGEVVPRVVLTEGAEVWEETWVRRRFAFHTGISSIADLSGQLAVHTQRACEDECQI